MNKLTFYNETFLLIALIVLLFFFINPLHVWMLSTLTYILLGAVVVVFGAFVGLVWNEHSLDEREEYHKMIAGRLAYLTGVAILLVGIFVETLRDQMPSLWLIIALGAMILVKIASTIYTRSRK